MCVFPLRRFLCFLYDSVVPHVDSVIPHKMAYTHGKTKTQNQTQTQNTADYACSSAAVAR
jgi:hypothetical protein